MKVLALEVETPGSTAEQFQPHLKAEARRVWELYQAGTLREIYFRQDWPGAVLILECADADEAHDALATLPLVQAGLIAFEIIALRPYPGLARLFSEDP
ncbi:MAG: superoxide dismutase [Chloroflexota bacterium]|jgi:muconolactone delta-isomerase